jgi:hypothetical protein
MRLRLSTLFLFYSLALVTLALGPVKAMAGPQDYRALSLDDCLVLARRDCL